MKVGSRYQPDLIVHLTPQDCVMLSAAAHALVVVSANEMAGGSAGPLYNAAKRKHDQALSWELEVFKILENAEEEEHEL